MNKRIILLPALVVLSFLHMACQTPSIEADVEAIRKILVEDYVEAESAGNVTAKVALFTDDAVLMPPNEPQSVGKDAIRSWHQSTYSQVALQVTDSVDKIEVFGDWGFARGSYTATISLRESGESSQESGKFLVILKRQPDSSWEIAYDMWSSNTSSSDTQ